jgi:two-component system cell cycle sensor histidine kinase/response regulator CckA
MNILNVNDRYQFVESGDPRACAERQVRGPKFQYVPINQIAAPIFWADGEAGLIEFNAAACRLTGYTRKELLSRHVVDLDPNIQPALWQDIQDQLRRNGTQSRETSLHRKDGTERFVHMTMNLMCRDGEEHICILVQDHTEQKLLEEKYRQAQKMEAVGRLAGGVAHDFNNLLTVINGYGEVILARIPEDDSICRLVREIKDAGERAAALTRQLLAFSRQQVIVPRILDLNLILKDTEKMLRRLLGEDVSIALRLHPELGNIKMDPTQVEQVVLNMVVNSRDAMPRGGTLTLETGKVDLSKAYTRFHPHLAAGPYILLTISDTGCGMDQATQSRIFEPFFSTKGKQGTGLGLATVYGIVRQAGGDIDVESAPDKGATFHIFLPQVDGPSESPNPRPVLHGSIRGTETLLLVEDDEAVRVLTRLVLESCGYQVLDAALPEEAIRICEQHAGEIQLLITDVVMPQIGGGELARRLTQRRPAMKVLFLSGYTDDLVVQHGVLREESEFLQKPFLPGILAKKVRDILDRPVTPVSQGKPGGEP